MAPGRSQSAIVVYLGDYSQRHHGGWDGFFLAGSNMMIWAAASSGRSPHPSWPVAGGAGPDPVRWHQGRRRCPEPLSVGARRRAGRWMRALLAHALLVLAGRPAVPGPAPPCIVIQAKRASPASSALTAMWSWPLAGWCWRCCCWRASRAVLWPAGGRRGGAWACQ